MMRCSILVLTFILASAAVAHKDPHCIGGRHGIVHLFEWKWDDIAAECERFLGPYGFCAVQTSPANEHRVITSPNRPWFERYQPVSYKIETRSGNEEQFRNMVSRCAAQGVRIYVDVVINHMTAGGGTGTGTGGTSFDHDRHNFPGVPYGPWDFNDGSNCHSSDLGISNYNNVEEVRNCRLVGLLDLKMSKDYVRTKISEYLNHLIDLGVTGFRVDAAKHMWPADLAILFNKVKNLPSGEKPFIFQEVIDHGGEAISATDYINNGRITNFKFGHELAWVFRRNNPLRWLRNFGSSWNMWNDVDVVNFIDNHDNQRDGNRGVLTYREPVNYKLATAFMLSWPYGIPRIMSSFSFDLSNTDVGPPHNEDMSIKTVRFTSNMTCLDGWVCEHRWRQVYNMVAFRNMAGSSPVSNWWVGSDYQIAYSRGDRAFIAFNLEDFDMDEYLMTGLPAGAYCDVISGNLENGTCTGRSIVVDVGGRANIQICSNCDDPMVAIHVGAKVGSLRY